ncbi:hypothetical protein Hanom_Chr04g00367531 [Helianthus anomalus]
MHRAFKRARNILSPASWQQIAEKATSHHKHILSLMQIRLKFVIGPIRMTHDVSYLLNTLIYNQQKWRSRHYIDIHV